MASPAKRQAPSEAGASPRADADGRGEALHSEAFGERAWVIRPQGPVALLETRAIERATIRAATGGRKTIVLDLTAVTQLGPGLLGGILRIRRGLGGIDGRLVLVVDGPPADALVRVSVIQVLVDVVATLDEVAVLLGDGRGGP